MPTYIHKRDGVKTLFDTKKIYTALKKAFAATHGESDETVLADLSSLLGFRGD